MPKQTWWRGRKHTPETIAKMSLAQKGRIPWNKGKTIRDETKQKTSLSLKGRIPWNKGINCSLGARAWNWKGGITPANAVIRHSIEYRLWRTSVFERDNYTCRFCGIRGGQLQADHIKPFALFPELRFAIDNGRTLCIDCHKKTETYGNRQWWLEDKQKKALQEFGNKLEVKK